MGRKSKSHRIQLIKVPTQVKVPARRNKAGKIIGKAFTYTRYKTKEIYHEK